MSRYLFGLAMVAAATGQRDALDPWTGPGAPFVLLFGAVVVTSLVAGRGPSLLALCVSLPVAVWRFAIPAGATLSQAGLQASLYAIAALIIIYLVWLMRSANRRMHAANAELAQAEARTRQTLELAVDAFFEADLDGRYVVVNDAACELLGYARSELLGKTPLDLIPPEDAPRLAEVKTQLLTAGQSSRGEWTLRRKDGTFVPVELSAKILPGGRWQAFVRDITERRRAEDQLRQSELQLRQLIDHLPDAVFINQAERIAYANQAFADLLGYESAAALIGRLGMELIHPDAAEAVKERIRVVYQSGQAARPREATMLRRDGSPCSVESVAVRVQFRGQPAIVVVVRDLTERKRASEALRLSEAKFSGIVSISADAIISIDDQQRITVFNHGAEEIFGYSSAEVIGAPLEVLLPERMRSNHRGHVADFGASEAPARRMGERLAMIFGRRKNGDEFPAEASISKLRVGETTLLTVALRDVTERARAEREQRLLADVGVTLAATLDYEQTLATVAQIVVRDFADWCVVEVMEEGGLRRLKMASADPAKEHISETYERFQIDRSRPYLTRPVVEAKQPVVVERFEPGQLEAIAQGPEHLELLRAIAPVSTMTVPLFRHDQLLGTLTFVSSRQTRLYGAADLRLAQAIAERAALAIENARLYRASVAATRLRDEVLSVVAHDLRSPLTNILLQVSTMRRGTPEVERRNQRPREAIWRSANRMNRLIQDLLDVAVLEAGRLRVDRAELSPHQLLTDAFESQRAVAAEASLDLRLDVRPELPPVWGDNDRLQQVFENLIGNAVKFTEPGGRITLGAMRGEKQVLFTVADTGRGISPEDVPHVFDRFWQASARDGRRGAGLGLSIAKGIIESLGGTLWVDSVLGQGTTFHFALPIVGRQVERPSVDVH